MSTGNTLAINDVPPIDDAFYERVRTIVAKAQMDRMHTIPWLANRSRDCNVIYIDKIVPLTLPVTKLLSAETIPYHEAGEWLGMNDGYSYQEAHTRFGNACEKRRVEEVGGNWEAYSDDLTPFIKENETEAMTNLPADIDERVFGGGRGRHKACSAVTVEEFARVQTAAGGRNELLVQLRAALAETWSFYFKAHTFHWNVVGIEFAELHALFGKVYEDAHGAVDTMAEYIRSIGEFAPVSLAEIVGPATIESNGTSVDALGMLTQLGNDNGVVITALSRAMAAANAAGEYGIANGLQGRIESHRKFGWMLRASLGMK